MAHLIDKDAVIAEIEKLFQQHSSKEYVDEAGCVLDKLEDIINTIEVKEVNIDKLCEFRKNVGFAYPECASEYQKQLACYRQGIEDVIEAQKGEQYDME